MSLPLLSLLVACAPKGVRDRGARPMQTSVDQLNATLQPRRRAILVGVNDYTDPSFPPLRHARADAEALAALLQDEQGGFDEVTLLTGVDLATTIAALQRARSELRREDELVVYFSGHGTRTDTGDRYLLLSDSRARDLPHTALSLTALQDFFASLPPARKALIVDACFNGEGKSAARRLAGALPPESLRAASMGPGEAHLFATSPGRPSRESDALGHGVYTHYMLEALSWSFSEADLDGDRVVSAYEAHDYARGRTMAFTDGVQVPEATFRIVGEGDLVLVGSPDERVRRDRALVYLYPLADSTMSGASLTIDGRDRGTLPGTVPVVRGRHHIGLYAPDGAAIAEGHAKLRGGRAYRADELARMVQGPSGSLSLQPVTQASAPLVGVLGEATRGGQLSVMRRVNSGTVRGLTGTLRLGAGRSMRAEDTRAVWWSGAAVGWQEDYRWLRYRAGWGISGAFIPATAAAITPLQTPTEAGWLIGMTGPEVGAGVVLSEAWSVTGGVSTQGSWLDLSGDGQAALVPWWTGSVGVELSF